MRATPPRGPVGQTHAQRFWVASPRLADLRRPACQPAAQPLPHPTIRLDRVVKVRAKCACTNPPWLCWPLGQHAGASRGSGQHPRRMPFHRPGADGANAERPLGLALVFATLSHACTTPSLLGAWPHHSQKSTSLAAARSGFNRSHVLPHVDALSSYQADLPSHMAMPGSTHEVLLYVLTAGALRRNRQQVLGRWLIPVRALEKPNQLAGHHRMLPPACF